MKYINSLFAFLLILSACKKKQKTNQIQKTETIEVIEEIIKEEITFASRDGLTITADVYKVNKSPITVLLCHQAGFSRGEYKDTALKINKLGHSAMAIDQRSGNIANDIINETAKLAKTKKLPTNFLDAKQDIEAAIDYIYENNGNRKIILVGSSYSATLALLIATENDKVLSVAAFSPGEYFKGTNIQESIKGLKKPTFVTSSFSETEALTILLSKIVNPKLSHYKPTEKGIHGSRALWESTEGYDGYFKAFSNFLSTFVYQY